jgi:hypothetical protein
LLYASPQALASHVLLETPDKFQILLDSDIRICFIFDKILKTYRGKEKQGEMPCERRQISISIKSHPVLVVVTKHALKVLANEGLIDLAPVYASALVWEEFVDDTQRKGCVQYVMRVE